MIESRRAASPTGPSTWMPSESGPRCTSVALIAATRSGSTARPVEAVPQMPHMPDYSSATLGGAFRTSGACKARRKRGNTSARHTPHVPLAEFGTQQELQLLMLLVSAAALL